jgi:hypothetical protein
MTRLHVIFDLRQNVSREQNRVLFAKTLMSWYLPDLIWIRPMVGSSRMRKVGLVQERVGQANPLPVTFGKSTD